MYQPRTEVVVTDFDISMGKLFLLTLKCAVVMLVYGLIGTIAFFILWAVLLAAFLGN